MVDQTINQCCRQAVITQDGIPLAELQIGGDNNALPFISPGYNVEQQLCPVPVQGHKTEFVDDDQVYFFQVGHQLPQFSLTVAIKQVVYQVKTTVKTSVS